MLDLNIVEELKVSPQSRLLDDLPSILEVKETISVSNRKAAGPNKLPAEQL